MWDYLRDERPHAGTTPPAVLYRCTPDRKGEHCRKELGDFTGWLHADGYASLARHYEIGSLTASAAALMHGPARVAEVACWSHAWLGCFDEWSEHKSAIAKEALDRIGALFDIERTIASSPPEIRRAALCVIPPAPSRACRRQRWIDADETPWRPATALTELPSAKASATSACRSASDRRRRGSPEDSSSLPMPASRRAASAT